MPSMYDVAGRDMRGEQLAMGMQIKDPADKRRWLVIAGWRAGSNQHVRIAIVYRAAGQTSRGADVRVSGDDNGTWDVRIKADEMYRARKL